MTFEPRDVSQRRRIGEQAGPGFRTLSGNYLVSAVSNLGNGRDFKFSCMQIDG